MLEDSVEGFVARFRSAAAEVTLTGHVEGSPLLECVVAGTAVHVFERTGPYVASTGAARVILHLECDALERFPAGDGAPERRFTVVGLSVLSVDAVVLERDDPYLVVDAGVPLVLGLTVGAADLAVGDHVRVVSRPPVHAFVLPRASPSARTSLDDQV